MGKCLVTNYSPGKVSSSLPSLDQYYVLVMFDISNAKKARRVVKVLKSYGSRIQKSVFEAFLNQGQTKELKKGLERIMSDDKYLNDNDSIRMFAIAGNCEATAFGPYHSSYLEENIVL